jgi:RNA polymerase sigma-70 factor (ECF subfamily)
MSENRPDDRLSQISTAWTALFRAHEGPADDEGRQARRRLLELYGVPVYRYLKAAARDPDAADELYQEFALRLVRGDFRAARPDRGRFRDFLKTALYHLVVDHRRRQARRPAPLPADDVAAEADDVPAASDEAFLTGWREEVLARAWQDLARHERETGQPLHTVLRFRADYPDATSQQIAEALTPRLGRAVDAGWVRKRLHQAREAFAGAVVGEVGRTVDPATRESVAEELLELGLLDYCRDALDRLGVAERG